MGYAQIKDIWLKGRTPLISATFHFSPVTLTTIDSRTWPQSPSWWTYQETPVSLRSAGNGYIRYTVQSCVTWKVIRSSKPQQTYPALRPGFTCQGRPDSTIQQFMQESEMLLWEHAHNGLANAWYSCFTGGTHVIRHESWQGLKKNWTKHH